MKFPYGLSDFGTLIRSGYWYQDRTDRLPLIEDAGRQLIFLRPRRFGKSLLLSMLEHYYDLNRAGEFEELLIGLMAVGESGEGRTWSDQSGAGAVYQSGRFQAREQPGQGALGQAARTL